MGFAEDEVKEYIRRNYPKFHDLRLNQLLDYLPCLTPADRQKIKCDTRNDGDILSVHDFFDTLWCRKGWVMELVSALENNNSDLAKDIRKVYQDALLPSQKTQAARSPYFAQCSRSPVSVPVGHNAPSSDDPPLSPPHNQPRPTRDPLPTCVKGLAPAPSAFLQDVVDYRSPVQETKYPSGSSEATLEAEACEIKRKISTPDLLNRNTAESEVCLAAQRENPISAQTASSRFLVQHQTPLREVSEKELQSSTPISSRSDAGNLVRNWDGVQLRPVCVKNGCFGNVSRSVDSGVSPAPEPAVSSAPTASRNQPEENFYLSSDSSLITSRGQGGAQAEEQKIPPLWGYQQDNMSDNPVNKPFLQLRVDEERKGAQGQQESTSNVLPRVDLREMPSVSILTGSLPANLQRRGEALPPSISRETTTANCFEQDPSSMCSEEVSHDHSQCREATLGGGQFSKGNTVDRGTRGPFVPKTPQTASSPGQFPSKNSKLPQGSSRKEPLDPTPNTISLGGFQSMPSDFSSPSSTDVIPPSSPAAYSTTLSDGYLEDLKSPVQDRDLPGTDLWTTSEKMIGDLPPRATVAWPSLIPDIPANSRCNRNNASGPSKGAPVFNPNHEEEDISLLKPGVLVSGEIPGGPLDQQPSNPDAKYSGRSNRLRFSSESSEESDSLMLSDSTQSSLSEVPERNTLTGTKSASLSHRNDSHSDGGSIKTHVVRIKEPPTVDLSAAPEMTRPALGKASQPPGDFSDFAAEDQLTENANSSICNDDQQNSCKNKSASSAESWHMSDSVLLTVGLTLTSLVAVAFVLYKQLKK